MQPAFPAVQPIPVSSLIVESYAYMGQNQIKRALGKSVHNYQGESVVDRIIQLEIDESFSIDEYVAAFQASSNGGLAVELESVMGNFTIEMREHLFLDMEFSHITITNYGTALVQLHISYLAIPTPSVDPEG